MTTRPAVTGDREPLVWLDGAANPVVAGLAGMYRVFAPAPLGDSFEERATNAISFIETLGFDSVRLAGCGDGALVALLVALRRPRLVHRLVFVSRFATDGFRGVDLGDLANLRTPTLLVAADSGIVSLDAVAQLCREFFAA